MKIKLKAYKYVGMLKRNFSNIEQAQQTAELAADKFPDMIFEPEMEFSDISAIDLSDFWKDGTQDVNPWQSFNRP